MKRRPPPPPKRRLTGSQPRSSPPRSSQPSPPSADAVELSFETTQRLTADDTADALAEAQAVPAARGGPEIRSIGWCATAVRPWEHRRGARLTAVVKCHFQISNDGSLTMMQPPPFAKHEQLLAGRVVNPGELAPKRARAEMYIHGNAYPQAEGNRGVVSVRVARVGTVLLQKRIDVMGMRENANAQPARFRSFPMWYSHALGSPSHAPNPLGTGLGATANRPPNIVDPKDPQGRVAGTAARPRLFPERRKQKGSLTDEQLKAAKFEAPDDFNWEYFQAAPADQQFANLRGDEVIDIVGMTASQSGLRIALPGLQALVRIHDRSANARRYDLPLKLDQVLIETESMHLSLLWRASIPLQAHAAAATLSIEGGVASFGQKPSFNAPVAIKPPSHHSTTVNEENPTTTPMDAPFPIASATRKDAAPGSNRVPGAPWDPRPDVAPLPPVERAQTLVVPDAAQAPPRRAQPGRKKLSETVTSVLDLDSMTSTAAPFDIASAGTSPTPPGATQTAAPATPFELLPLETAAAPSSSPLPRSPRPPSAIPRMRLDLEQTPPLGDSDLEDGNTDVVPKSVDDTALAAERAAAEIAAGEAAAKQAAHAQAAAERAAADAAAEARQAALIAKEAAAAEARRQEDAKRFEEAQQRAREAELKAEELKKQDRKKRAAAIRQSMYDGFGIKR